MSRIEPDASVQRQAPWPFQRARNSAEVATPLAGSGNDAPAGDVAGMRATGRYWFDRRARDHIRTRALRSSSMQGELRCCPNSEPFVLI
jgi:hypothetical protein